MSHFLDFTPRLKIAQGLPSLTHFIPALKDGAFVLRNGKALEHAALTKRDDILRAVRRIISTGDWTPLDRDPDCDPRGAAGAAPGAALPGGSGQ